MDFLLSLVIVSSSHTKSDGRTRILSKTLFDLLSQGKWEIISFGSSPKPTGSVDVNVPESTNSKLLQLTEQLRERAESSTPKP